MICEGIRKAASGLNLSSQEASEVMREIASGTATPAQIAAFLTALHMKGETAEEIAGLAFEMRRHAFTIKPSISTPIVDTCGTGGDRIKTFNISTAAAFIVAGAGVAVAKHGNRSVTSRCGSADVLERLGLNLNMTPENVQKMIEQVGIGFMFAPCFHPSMKHALTPRREIGIRTVFNLLGPLSNPACAEIQLLGVCDEKLVFTLAQALSRLGCREAMVVHGIGGLDEVSTIGQTVVAHVHGGKVSTSIMRPEDFGVKRALPDDVAGGDSDHNARLLFEILYGKRGCTDAKTEVVLVNSAAAIFLSGKAEDFTDAMETAKESLASGKAFDKLKALVKASGGNLSRIEEFEKEID
jgi:anthranilate phosphoribosyltransferase